MEYRDEIDAGVSAVLEASILCREIQKSLNRFKTLRKGDLSPVTTADFASQVLIISKIKEYFPTDVILGEENSSLLRDNKEYSRQVLIFLKQYIKGLSVNELWEILDQGKSDVTSINRFWLVDPVDGTKGFLRGDQFSIALSLIESGEVRLGILGCPNLDAQVYNPYLRRGCILYSIKGRGTRVKALDGKSEEGPVFRNRRIDIKKARICESIEAGHTSHELHLIVSKLLGIKKAPLRIDSQVKYALLALGMADIYLRIPRQKEYREKVWDHAAGVVILNESGGEVTDLSGRALDFAKGQVLEKNYGIAASAGGIHEDVLRAIAQIQQGLWERADAQKHL